MQNRAMISGLMASVGLALVSTSALAQETGNGLSIGALVATSQSPYIGQNQTTGIVPVLRYSGERFTIGSDGIGIKAIDTRTSKLSFHLAPRLSPLSAPSEPQLAGITRDHGVDAAISYEYRFSQQFGLSARVSKGLTDAQRGTEVILAARSAVSLGAMPLLLSAGASWKSAELGQYYYGVNAADVAVGRPAYTVGASTTPFVSIGSSMPIGDNARLFGTVRADFFGSEITNSPIVSRSTVVSAALGLSYSF